MRPTHPLLPVMIALLLFLSACGRVEGIAGVDLATASPTATRPPSEFALPLPRSLEKDFLGTVFTMNYPDGWETNEGGQSIGAIDPNPAFGDGARPGVGMFVALTRTVGMTENDDTMAPEVMARFLARGAEFGMLPQDAVPDESGALAFDWGGYDSAIYRWQNNEEGMIGVQVIVLDEDKRRFVVIGTQTTTGQWPDFETTWLDMLGSFTLNGNNLPAVAIQTAFQAAAVR